MKLLINFICVLILNLILQTASAGQFERLHEFLPTPEGVGGHQTRNGLSLDSDQNHLIMGNGGNSNGLGGSATIFKYENNDWVEYQTLRPPYDYQQYFGHAVAIQGNVAVVSAPKGYGADYESGVAYVYELFDGIWLLTQTIQSNDGSDSEFFGYSVTIEDNDILIGSPKNDFVNTNVGAVEVFSQVEGTWQLTQKLDFSLPSMNMVYSNFGYSIDSSDGRVVVSAPSYNNEEGIVFSYQKNGGSWQETDAFQTSDKEFGANFGIHLALDQGDLIVSAILANQNFSGKVYFHELNGDEWIEISSYSPSDPDYEEELGSSVGIYNGVAVAGARKNDDLGDDKGALYLFEKIDDNWIFQQKVYNPDYDFSSNFGRSSVVIGSEVIGSNSYGETYSFIKFGGLWESSQYVSPNLGSTDQKFGRLTQLNEKHAIVFASDRWSGKPYSVYFHVKNEAGQWELVTKHELEAVENSKGMGMALDNDRLVLFAHDLLYVFEYNKGQWGLMAQYDLPYVKFQIENDEIVEQAQLSQLILKDNTVVSLTVDYVNEISQLHVLSLHKESAEVSINLLEEFSVNPYQFYKDIAFVEDDLLIIPYVLDNVEQTNVLKVYQLVDKQWIDVGNIESPSPEFSLSFGTELAYDKNMLAVGDFRYSVEPGNNIDDGGVHLYLYQERTWVYEETLAPDIGFPDYNRFGIKLYLNGEILIVRSDQEGDGDDLYYDQVLHKYSKIGGDWSEEYIHESDYHRYDAFAEDIAGFEDQILVGIPNANYYGQKSGRATIYSISTGYQLSGTVTNLLPGNTLQLRLNNRDLISVDQTDFSFGMELPEGHLYDVSMVGAAKPFTQVCSVSNGQGVIASENINDIEVVCEDFVDLIFENSFE